MRINGSTIEASDVTVDVTTLKSDMDRRDNAIRNRGLQTDTFKEATFKLTEPIKLASVPKQVKRSPPCQGRPHVARADEVFRDRRQGKVEWLDDQHRR